MPRARLCKRYLILRSHEDALRPIAAIELHPMGNPSYRAAPYTAKLNDPTYPTVHKAIEAIVKSQPLNNYPVLIKFHDEELVPDALSLSEYTPMRVGFLNPGDTFSEAERKILELIDNIDDGEDDNKPQVTWRNEPSDNKPEFDGKGPLTEDDLPDDDGEEPFSEYDSKGRPTKENPLIQHGDENGICLLCDPPIRPDHMMLIPDRPTVMESRILISDEKVDPLLKVWSENLQAIYDNRTAGDYTFLGALTLFLREVVPVLDVEVREAPALPARIDLPDFPHHPLTDPYKH